MAGAFFMTNWITPTANDLAKVISLEILRKSNENIDDESINAAYDGAGNSIRPPYDQTLANRAAEQIDLAVKQFRGAIQNGGKYPLSVTPNSVPPETLRHVLYLAAFGLVNSNANLLMVVMNEANTYAPLQVGFKAADEYLQKLTKGGNIVTPTDPTGRDYQTAINVPWFYTHIASPYPAYDSTKPLNPPLAPVRVGANSAQSDMTTNTSHFETLPWGCFPSQTLGQP